MSARSRHVRDVASGRDGRRRTTPYTHAEAGPRPEVRAPCSVVPVRDVGGSYAEPRGACALATSRRPSAANGRPATACRRRSLPMPFEPLPSRRSDRSVAHRLHRCSATKAPSPPYRAPCSHTEPPLPPLVLTVNLTPGRLYRQHVSLLPTLGHLVASRSLVAQAKTPARRRPNPRGRRRVTVVELVPPPAL
jgi:hypothetical protein